MLDARPGFIIKFLKRSLIVNLFKNTSFRLPVCSLSTGSRKLVFLNKFTIRERFKNFTLNSVFDGNSNKTITKAICLKGPKLFSAKGMASLYFCSDNRVI